mmetsp:Transcript_2587/g.6627  ORF Transcript_2587/g.6627 Transcript_2587/m.6627 type:complete len:126 (-) Transcript_2587:413-790(-)
MPEYLSPVRSKLLGVNRGRSQPAFVDRWSGAQTSALIACRVQQSGAAVGIAGCVLDRVSALLILDAKTADARAGSLSHLVSGVYIVSTVRFDTDRCRLLEANAGWSFWPRATASEDDSVTTCFVL